MLKRVEHEKSFITSGPGLALFCDSAQTDETCHSAKFLFIYSCPTKAASSALLMMP